MGGQRGRLVAECFDHHVIPSEAWESPDTQNRQRKSKDKHRSWPPLTREALGAVLTQVIATEYQEIATALTGFAMTVVVGGWLLLFGLGSDCPPRRYHGKNFTITNSRIL